MTRNFNSGASWTMLVALAFSVTAVFSAFTFIPADEASAWHCELSVDKSTIEAGESVKLSWDYTYPDKFEIDNGVGTITKDNSFKMVSPSETTTYKGSVTDKKNRTAYCEVTVVVKKKTPKPTCEVTADDREIWKGESTYVRWISTNAVSGNITNIGNVDLSGSKKVTPTDDIRYSGYFKNSKGDEVYCMVDIKVKEKPQQPKTPSCEMFSPNEYPNFLNDGDSTKVSWATTNASSIPDGYFKIKEKAPLTDVFMKPFSGIIFKEYSQKFALNDEMSVTPTRDTDYVGYLYNKNDVLVDSCIVEIDIKKKKEPWCKITIDKPRVIQGKNNEVTITWDSTNVTSGFINNGIGSVANTGSKTFTVNESTTYTATFNGPNGEVKCKTEVVVECPHCGGGNNQPRVELIQRYEPAATSSLAFVSLTQVPYTGFEAGPITTALFWSIVVLWSAAIGYQMLVHGGWNALFATLIPSPYAREFPQPVLVGGGNYVAEPERTLIEEEDEPIEIAYVESRGIPPMNLPGSQPSQQPAFKEVAMSQAPVSANSIIEEMAYAEKILVSIEAVEAIAELAGNSKDNARGVAGEVFNKAKGSFPRVDGWIHLTRDKVNSLAGSTAHAPEPVFVPTPEVAARPAYIAEPVMPAMPAAKPIAMNQSFAQTGTKTDPAAMIAYITSGAEESAFKALRAHLAAGGSVQSLFADVAGAVDSAYRSRIEGGSADSRVVERFQSWKAEDIEGILSILSGGLDYSYSTPHTAGKITLAKLFEFARSRKA